MAGILLTDIFAGMAMMAGIRIYGHGLSLSELIYVAGTCVNTGSTAIAFFLINNNFCHSSLLLPLVFLGLFDKSYIPCLGASFTGRIFNDSEFKNAG